MGILDIADGMVGTAAALGGFILVFVGAAAASFDGFPADSQSAVRAKYQFRIWLGVAGLALSFGSAGAALLANAADSECAAWVALVLLGIAALATIVAAVLLALDVS